MHSQNNEEQGELRERNRREAWNCGNGRGREEGRELWDRRGEGGKEGRGWGGKSEERSEEMGIMGKS